MIERLVVENFKSLRRVDLRLGRFNLLIGANASGKSNFLEVLRVLQGIGHGFTVGEILDGKPRSATTEIWDGIRGGSARACFAGKPRETANQDARSAPNGDEVKVEAYGKLDGGGDRSWRFSTTLTPRRGRVAREWFGCPSETYDTEAADSASRFRYYSGEQGGSPDLDFDARWPVIGQFTGDRFSVQKERADAAGAVAALFANMQHVAPDPERLRGYSDARLAQRMGGRGEDFAAVVRTICRDAEAKDAYLSWLRQLRLEEVDDVGVLSGAVGEPLFMLREGGREFPAPVLSGGTLRFAAIAAAFFQPDMPRLLTIEEIENGVYPSRLLLLVELLRSQAETRGAQVFATTHSPTVLDWLEEEDYRTTFLFRRDHATGESKVRSLADLPHFVDVIRKKRASELLSEGWLEVAS